MSKQLAFIGLGVMGYPMAGHLQRAGHQVTVYNRSREKTERWVAEFGGLAAETPFAAARHADIVFTCVGNDGRRDHQAVTGRTGNVDTIELPLVAQRSSASCGDG